MVFKDGFAGIEPFVMNDRLSIIRLDTVHDGVNVVDDRLTVMFGHHGLFNFSQPFVDAGNRQGDIIDLPVEGVDSLAERSSLLQKLGTLDGRITPDALHAWDFSKKVRQSQSRGGGGPPNS